MSVASSFFFDLETKIMRTLLMSSFHLVLKNRFISQYLYEVCLLVFVASVRNITQT